MRTEVKESNMTWVYLAMRSFNCRHVIRLRQLMRECQCAHTVLILSCSAALRMYGPTLSARGAFWFHRRTAEDSAGEDDEDSANEYDG